MTREEAGAKLADEYASKHWSGDDYTAAFDSFIAGYQAALTPQPSAEDAAVLDALEEAYADVLDIPDKIAGVDSIAAVNARHTEARAAVLARMAGKVPEGWRLVPETPTEKMMEAIDAVNDGEAAFLRQTGGNVTQASWADTHRRAHAAMLAAAPKVPT